MMLADVRAMVDEIACQLIPGWQVTVELAPSVEQNQGALAMVYTTPERQLAHVVVAPHPPGESVRESIAHELTHAVLSPLTKLIEWSPAAVMLEEQIVERLGKLIATAPANVVRAMMRAIRDPRTKAQTIRKRISALAIGRRNEGKRRMDPKALAALAMEGGALTATENPDPAAMAEWIKKAVEIMASSGGADAGPPSAPMRDDKAGSDPAAPPMREDQMPPQMRAAARQLARTSAMALASTVRMRIHEARTVDKLDITPAMETRLLKSQSVEAFEDAFELLKLGLVGAAKARSGATQDETTTTGSGPSIEQLVREGIPQDMAAHVRREYERGADFGKAAQDVAMKYRKAAQSG